MSASRFGSATDAATCERCFGRPTASEPSARQLRLVRLPMLRITDATGPHGVTIVLEGRLAGPWVDELAQCWNALAAPESRRAICVQLDGVTFIDAAGKALLRAMHEKGTSFVASGCMTCAILEEIKQHER